MAGFNDQFLYSVIIIAIGYVLKRFDLIKEKDGEGLSRIVFNLTLPALIIVTFHDIEFESSLLLLIVFGLIYGLFSGVLAILVFRGERKKTKGMLAMMVPGFNIGLFAYPLVEGIWGATGVKYFGMFDVGNAFIVFGLSYFLASFYSDQQAKLDIKNVTVKLSKSVPFMAYIVVCTLNLMGVQLPEAVVHVSGIISVANMPMSLLLLGIYLSFNLKVSYFKPIAKLLALRYVVGLGVGILLFLVLPFNDMFKYTVLISLILPVAMSVVPYSVEFGYDKKFVGTFSNLTIIISFVLMWGMANIIM